MAVSSVAVSNAPVPQMIQTAELREDLPLRRVDMTATRGPVDGTDADASRPNNGGGPSRPGVDIPASVEGPQPKEPPAAESKGEGPRKLDEETKRAIKQVQGYSVPELMKQLRNGTIPEAITNSPDAMLLMNQRLQAYSQMIQMMSNMMQADHDLKMAIIRNIKA
jgi:hypothetical protein